MSTEPGPPSDGFDAVVAGWRQEGGVPQWPDFDGPPRPHERPAPLESPGADLPRGDARRSDTARDDTARSDTARDDTARDDTARPGPARPDGIERGPAADPLTDDDHFVPPEPPPLPRLALPIAVGLALLVLGLVLVWAPDWIGVPQVYGLPLGLVGLACGLGWLVLRLWPDADGAGPPLGHDPDDPDDGAVL